MDEVDFIEMMRDRIPDIYEFLYRCREEGFTDEEAFTLTQALFQKVLDLWG